MRRCRQHWGGGGGGGLVGGRWWGGELDQTLAVFGIPHSWFDTTPVKLSALVKQTCRSVTEKKHADTTPVKPAHSNYAVRVHQWGVGRRWWVGVGGSNKTITPSRSLVILC